VPAACRGSPRKIWLQESTSLLLPARSALYNVNHVYKGNTPDLLFLYLPGLHITLLDRVHVDTVGPISPPAITGERFWVTVVDESSHQTASLPVKSKDCIPKALMDLLRSFGRPNEALL
jgi:hypothetical protein